MDEIVRLMFGGHPVHWDSRKVFSRINCAILPLFGKNSKGNFVKSRGEPGRGR